MLLLSMSKAVAGACSEQKPGPSWPDYTEQTIVHWPRNASTLEGMVVSLQPQLQQSISHNAARHGHVMHRKFAREPALTGF